MRFRGMQILRPSLAGFQVSPEVVCAVNSLGFDSVNLCAALFRSRARLAAENLFLRKQLAPKRRTGVLSILLR
jgi:hypothetical protein